MILVSVIIPVFGPEHFLRACLNALEVNTEGHETILIDNAMGFEMTADAVIRNPLNLGFAKACNEGAHIAHGEYLLFLNVDTEVQPGWLEPLVKAMEDPEVAMCGPRIIHPDGSLQTSGVRTWHGGGSAGGEELKDDSPSRDVDGVTGACMMVRTDVFKQLGMFDTGFYNGYDDVDICLQVREAGYRIRYINESTIVHHESATGPERWAKVHENVAYMNSKWGTR